MRLLGIIAALGLLVAGQGSAQSLSGGGGSGLSLGTCVAIHTPSLASYTIGNQGTATIADTGHGISIGDIGATTGSGIRVIYKPVPATPYSHAGS